MDDPTRLILAINDEPAILEIYVDLLTQEGFRVETELRPEVEVADVKALAPDLVVLDLLVGRLDWGTTFLAMLKADPDTRDLPVVVCTAARDVVQQLGPQLAAWGVTVVAKPFDIDEFVRVVRATLDPGAGESS